MNRAAVFLAATAAVMSAPLAAAGQPADNFPPRKPGQWEARMVTEKPAGGPSMTTQMCIDAATDRELMDFGLRMSKDTCKRYDLKRAGGGWVIDAECAFGPIKSISKTTISGDFQSSVTVRIEGTTEGIPGKAGPQPTLMTQTARWVAGTCGKGMIPGDIAMENGIKFNVKQMKGLQRLLPQIQIK